MNTTQLSLEGLFNSLFTESKPIKKVTIFIGPQYVNLCADGKVMMTTQNDGDIDEIFLCSEIEDLFISDLTKRGVIDECLSDETLWEKIVKNEGSQHEI